MAENGIARFLNDFVRSYEDRDYVNGCAFCGHLECGDACCDVCPDPGCYRTYNVCPTCTKEADRRSVCGMLQ